MNHEELERLDELAPLPWFTLTDRFTIVFAADGDSITRVRPEAKGDYTYFDPTVANAIVHWSQQAHAELQRRQRIRRFPEPRIAVYCLVVSVLMWISLSFFAEVLFK